MQAQTVKTEVAFIIIMRMLPVKSGLAVLKRILLPVFAKHLGSHCLEHMTVQQSLTHTHHFVP